MPSLNFTQPPNTQRNATLYQHARETLRFAREANDLMLSLDNQDGVDINNTPGTVITGRPQDVRWRHNLVGALQPRDYTSVSGQVVDGQLDLKLRSDSSYEAARLTYRETADSISASLEAPPAGHYEFHPGTVTVTQNKATGDIHIEQQADFPWRFEFSGGVPEQEVLFAPSGPTDQGQVSFYQQGQKFQAAVEAEMNKMKGLDNGPQDLNPQPGVVVAAGLERKNSDNLVYGHMAGDYPVPTEGMIRFDPATGQVSEYTRGFGDHNTLSYRREQGTQIFERNAFLNCDRLEVRSDGSRFQQHFQDTKLAGKAELYEQEHRVTTSILPRLMDGRNALAAAGWSSVVGTLVGLFSSGPAAVSITAGLAAAALTAGVVSAVKMPSIELNLGVNRFSGSTDRERLANAQKAMESFEASGYRQPRRLETGDQEVTREDCRSFLARSDTGYGGENLLILCDRLGDKGQPAVVMVEKDFHYPVKLQSEGLELPGGRMIPYSSILAMSDLS